jgi:hypothetical protein
VEPPWCMLTQKFTSNLNFNILVLYYNQYKNTANQIRKKGVRVINLMINVGKKDRKFPLKNFTEGI